MTVLAPNSSTRALRSGRRRLRALAAGDHEALIALDGEPLQVAVAPAVPLRQRGRRRGVGIPVAAQANVALAVGQGGFDIVHAFEPLLPGVSTSALRRSPGLTVATFLAPDRALHYPVRPGTLERYRARVDALLATSPAAAAQAAVSTRRLHGHPRGIGAAFVPGDKDGTRIVVEWHGGPGGRARPGQAGRGDARVELTLLWSRRSRRPLRPFVPTQARGRVHASSPEDADGRAAVLAVADVFVAGESGDRRFTGRRAPAAAPWSRPCRPARSTWTPRGSGMRSTSRSSRRPRPRRLLDDADLREARGGGGRAAAAERTFAAVAERIEQVYARLDRAGACTGARPPPAGPLISADLHMHTSHSYDCATDPEALVDHCIAQGLGAIAVTDHNEVDGALEAAALGKPIAVIVGEEVKTAQGEVIGLFLHERIEPGMSMGDTIAAIQEQGGLVYMPHPFDRLHTIPDPPTLLRHLDEIDILEVYNSRLLFDSFNDDALRFASKYNLIQAAGSDAHVLPGIGTALNRIPAFDGPEEFLLAMRQNEIVRRPKSLLYLQGLKWVQSVAR